MQLYAMRLGNELFSLLLFNRLGTETGISPNEIDTLQRTFSPKVTNAEFTAMVLTANTINATMNGDFTVRREFLSADQLMPMLAQYQIPLTIINTRMGYMQKNLGSN
jgi:hypothetical protein